MRVTTYPIPAPGTCGYWFDQVRRYGVPGHSDVLGL